MIHLIFVFVHILAILFGVIWLIFTIPAHIIASLLLSSNERQKLAAMSDEEREKYKRTMLIVRVVFILCILFILYEMGVLTA